MLWKRSRASKNEPWLFKQLRHAYFLFLGWTLIMLKAGQNYGKWQLTVFINECNLDALFMFYGKCRLWCSNFMQVAAKPPWANQLTWLSRVVV